MKIGEIWTNKKYKDTEVVIVEIRHEDDGNDIIFLESIGDNYYSGNNGLTRIWFLSHFIKSGRKLKGKYHE